MLFSMSWATAYTGYPNCVQVDQQDALTSHEFRKLCVHAGFEVGQGYITIVHLVLGPSSTFYCCFWYTLCQVYRRSYQYVLQQAYTMRFLSPSDPRGESSIFDASKSKELAGLLDKRVYEVVFKDDAPKGSNILGSRFVLTISNG